MQNKFALFAVDALVEAEWNYKEDHAELQEKLRANIARNGLVQNLIVRELPNGTYEVVNGNHRLRAIRDLGIVDVMCYDIGVVTDLQARRIAVETNEIRFKSDIERLSSVIDSILSEFDRDDFNLTSPVTSEMLDSFKGQSEWRPPPPIVDAPFLDLGVQVDRGVEFVCPDCNHQMTVLKSAVKKERLP